MVNLGDRLKTLREKKGLKQDQLGLQINVSKATICSYETGARKPPLENLVLLAQIFNVTTDYLLGIEPKDSIDLSGLSDSQIAALKTMVKSMKE